MNNESEIKELVREKYTAIAEQSQVQNASSCCGATSSCCGDEVYNIMADDYSNWMDTIRKQTWDWVADCQPSMQK